MALIGHPVVNDKQYTYGFATQMLRSGSAAQRSGQDAQSDEDPCSEADGDADAEACVPDEAADSCSSSSSSSQVWDMYSMLAQGMLSHVTLAVTHHLTCLEKV